MWAKHYPVTLTIQMIKKQANVCRPQSVYSIRGILSKTHLIGENGVMCNSFAACPGVQCSQRANAWEDYTMWLIAPMCKLNYFSLCRPSYDKIHQTLPNFPCSSDCTYILYLCNNWQLQGHALHTHNKCYYASIVLEFFRLVIMLK